MQGVTVVMCSLLAACGRSQPSGQSIDRSSPVPATAVDRTTAPVVQAGTQATATTFKTESGSIRPTACSLLQKTEVETAIGSPVGAARGEESQSVTSCTYTHDSEETSRTLKLTIEWDRPLIPKQQSQSSGPMITELDITDLDEHVDGIGDEATVLPGGLRVRKGHTVLTIMIKGERDAQMKLIAIAKTLLTRVGG